MNTIEYRLGNGLVGLAGDRVAASENLHEQASTGYDLDMLYVECRYCGKPVIWEKGKTSLLLAASGIDTDMLDEECLILSEGCPHCRPEAGTFNLQVVRLTALSAHDLLLLSDQGGSA